jgi:putative transposase
MLNGNDTILFPDRAKSDDFCQFLVNVRECNPLNRICLILDNFPTHKAKIVKDKAQRLNIELIFLPPYSPDLNPIEYIWKSIKRVVSITDIESKLQLIEIVRDSFIGLAADLSYARMWIPRFLYDKLNLLC